MFGGFDSLPRLDIGGGSDQSATSQPASKAAHGVAGASAASDEALTREIAGGDEGTQGNSGANNGNGSPVAHRPGNSTAPGQSGTSNGTTHGNANGQTPTKTTGKPVDSPGVGSTGTPPSNSGTNNGKALGKYK